ncbi:MAG: teichoic acid biosynthesis protein, N-acetylglucosaminyldiphosphoundecaprenol [Candidatus Peregrinibacteria bacterium GW2011_GWF2_38_29]|nr:MAG: teichoic acid biosynthesis protein, N-acetylglucosaminyldiphosphoundecaprenol [Candidatus Peregrinibacteria bacterium GW2011_GWF2_38_29]HBB02991.1 glycosyltransferase [Candidatus Peregrinibacteria bacterium]
MSERIFILGVPFDKKTKQEILDILLNWLKEDKKRHIATPNPEFILEAQINSHFKEILNKTDLNIPDGIGILWASSYAQNPKLLRGIGLLISILFHQKSCKKILKERVSGADLMLDICEKVTNTPHKIFLLGAREEIAQKASENLLKHFPALKIVGAYEGNPDEKNLLEKINDSKADILFVAYGAPKQEIWIHENLPKLTHIKLAMGVGGTFDFIAKSKKRAPKFMRNIGLEWLFRLVQEPKRIKRIWNAVIKFPYTVMKKR